MADKQNQQGKQGKGNNKAYQGDVLGVNPQEDMPYDMTVAGEQKGTLWDNLENAIEKPQSLQSVQGQQKQKGQGGSQS